VGGSASVVGHCFPVWTGFRGGKGVAASVGQCLATFPAYFPIDLGIAALSTANRGRSGQGVTTKNGGRPLTGAGNARTATFASSAAWVLGGLVWWRRRWPNLWGPTPSAGLPAAAAVSSAVIAYKFLTAHTPADIAHEAVDEAVAA